MRSSPKESLSTSKSRVDRRIGREVLLHGRQARLRVLRQACLVRFRALGRGAHQRAGVGEELAVERSRTLDKGMPHEDVAPGVLGLAISSQAPLAEASEALPATESRSAFSFAGRILEQGRIEQGVELLAAHLDRSSRSGSGTTRPCGAVSSPVFEYWIMRPRSSE